mmetsp:Transcript_66765/g.215844  ORF Transcript_66765/g.215844 Transcript_66765/m.215844 type:complete len:203 (+) Transcript_66765:1215-1823(+)
MAFALHTHIVLAVGGQAGSASVRFGVGPGVDLRLQLLCIAKGPRTRSNIGSPATVAIVSPAAAAIVVARGCLGGAAKAEHGGRSDGAAATHAGGTHTSASIAVALVALGRDLFAQHRCVGLLGRCRRAAELALATHGCMFSGVVVAAAPAQGEGRSLREGPSAGITERGCRRNSRRVEGQGELAGLCVALAGGKHVDDTSRT